LSKPSDIQEQITQIEAKITKDYSEMVNQQVQSIKEEIKSEIQKIR